VKGALRPSNAKRLYTEEKSTVRRNTSGKEKEREKEE